MNVAKWLPRFRRAYRELGRMEQRESWPRGDIEALQLERLNHGWGAACRTTVYYEELRKRHELPSRFGSVAEFCASVPVLSKADIRRAPWKFVPRNRGLGRWVSTGGSTGEPVRVFWDAASSLESLRSRYRYYAMWGVDIFDPAVFLWGNSLAFAPGVGGHVARVKQRLADRLRCRLRLSAYDLRPQRLREYLARIRSFGPATIYGYPSALELLAAEAERTGFQCPSVKLVTLTGEVVRPSVAEGVGRAFAAPATMEYGTAECGPIGHEWPDRQLHVREDQMLVETLPCEDGQFEIVVTVLTNSGFPLLRYRLADRTDEPLQKPQRGFAVLRRVSGRDNDFVTTRSGKSLHPARFEAFFKYQCPDVRRYGLRQQLDGSLRVTLEPAHTPAPRNLDAMASALREMVEGFAVTIELVDALPLTRVGKLRVVQSEFTASLRAAPG